MALFAANDDEDKFQLPKRKLADGEMDITPMIDCTFLLLIFFMVSSTMQDGPKVDEPISKNGIGVPTNNADSVLIRVDMKSGIEKPKIDFEYTTKSSDGQSAKNKKENLTIDSLRELVQTQVKSQRNQFIIRAERRVPHGTVQEVARAIKDVDGTQFFLGVQEK